MNNVRLEIEKADKVTNFVNGQDYVSGSEGQSPSNIFQMGSKYYFYSNILSGGKIQLYESTNCETFTLIGPVIYQNVPAELNNFVNEALTGPSIVTHEGVTYLTARSKEYAATLNNTDYGLVGNNNRVIHTFIVQANPLYLSYACRAKFSVLPKTDTIYHLFFDSFDNKWKITGRIRGQDADNWSASEDTAWANNWGQQPTPTDRSLPATGTEAPSNRRAIRIFAGPTTLNVSGTLSAVNTFTLEKLIDPKDVYNYTPGQINSTTPAKFSTIKPDFYCAPIVSYDKRLIGNIDVYLKDDRRATGSDNGYNLKDNLILTGMDARREGPIIPHLFFSRKNSNGLKLVQEKIQTGTYAGQPDFYKTYLREEDFATAADLSDPISESITNVYYRSLVPASYTATGPDDNPIPIEEIRQSYVPAFFIKDEDIYLPIFVRGYSHNETSSTAGFALPEATEWRGNQHRKFLVKLKKDRFFGWKSTGTGSFITTKLMSVDPQINYINVNAKGSYKVELLDENDVSLGFLLNTQNSDTHTVNEVNYFLPLPTRTYTEFKVRFHLLNTDTKIYAFRFYKPDTITVPDPDVVVETLQAPTLHAPANSANFAPNTNITLSINQIPGFTVQAQSNTGNRYLIQITDKFNQVSNYYRDGAHIVNGRIERIVSYNTEWSSGSRFTWRARGEYVVDGVVTPGDWSETREFFIVY